MEELGKVLGGGIGKTNRDAVGNDDLGSVIATGDNNVDGNECRLGLLNVNTSIFLGVHINYCCNLSLSML